MANQQRFKLALSVAALSLSTLDSEAEQDRDRASRWAGYWTLLSRSAKDRFESNQEGRSVSIADNALCSYRPDQDSKRECVWALLLDPSAPKIPVDALGLARSWAQESCWSAAKADHWASCEPRARAAECADRPASSQ